jgi:type II secretory pathway pseudopilin PulG
MNVSRTERGYAMAALLVGIAIMGVMLTVAMPAWRTMVKREREEELVFRGQQYARAIGLFQRKYANAYPPSLDVLVEQRFLRRKYTDPMTRDEDGREGAFQILYQGALPQRPGSPPGEAGASMGRGAGAGQSGAAPGGLGAQPPGPGTGLGRTGVGGQPVGPRGGVVGVASKSTEKSLRVYIGRTAYNEWQFIWSPAAGGGPTRPGAVPGTAPGGRRGSPRPPAGSAFDPRRQ